MSKLEYPSAEEIRRLEGILLDNLHAQAAQLGELLNQLNDGKTYGTSPYEDECFYRFYHMSFKVFGLQTYTDWIVAALRAIAPEGREFCGMFQAILDAGTGRMFNDQTNAHWLEQAGPIVQAFLHARYFLEMAVKYAAALDKPPQPLPSGWAALLELYQIR